MMPSSDSLYNLLMRLSDSESETRSVNYGPRRIRKKYLQSSSNQSYSASYRSRSRQNDRPPVPLVDWNDMRNIPDYQNPLQLDSIGLLASYVPPSPQKYSVQPIDSNYFSLLDEQGRPVSTKQLRRLRGTSHIKDLIQSSFDPQDPWQPPQILKKMVIHQRIVQPQPQIRQKVVYHPFQVPIQVPVYIDRPYYIQKIVQKPVYIQANPPPIKWNSSSNIRSFARSSAPPPPPPKPSNSIGINTQKKPLASSTMIAQGYMPRKKTNSINQQLSHHVLPSIMDLQKKPFVITQTLNSFLQPYRKIDIQHPQFGIQVNLPRSNNTVGLNTQRKRNNIITKAHQISVNTFTQPVQPDISRLTRPAISNQMLDQNGHIHLLNVGSSDLVYNQRDGLAWIGMKVVASGRSYFTHQCVYYPPFLSPNIVSMYIEARKADDLPVIVAMNSYQSLALIRDIYKGRQYYGYRMIKTNDNGSTFLSRNGFNLTPQQAFDFIKAFNKSLQHQSN